MKQDWRPYTVDAQCPGSSDDQQLPCWSILRNAYRQGNTGASLKFSLETFGWGYWREVSGFLLFGAVGSKPPSPTCFSVFVGRFPSHFFVLSSFPLSNEKYVVADIMMVF